MQRYVSVITINVSNLSTQGNVTNFANPAIAAICSACFYTRPDNLGILFPGEFKSTIPIPTLALIATAVCLFRLLKLASLISDYYRSRPPLMSTPQVYLSHRSSIPKFTARSTKWWAQTWLLSSTIHTMVLVWERLYLVGREPRGNVL